MTIRFPKRTIADKIERSTRQIETKQSVEMVKQPINEIKLDQLSVKPINKSIICDDHADTLYPAELLRLHYDLDQLAYANLDDKTREELLARLPYSLSSAEAVADQLLQSFVGKKVKSYGAQEYYNKIQASLSDSAKLMFYYRCAIACFDDYKPDKIEIYVSKEMNGNDFFPVNSTVNTMDSMTGEQIAAINYQDDGYERSDAFVTNRKVMSSKTATISPKDRLPPHYILNVKVAIKKTGNQVPKDSKEAWDCLNNISSNASIEDRILARIAYLITNAALASHKTNVLLPAP